MILLDIYSQVKSDFEVCVCALTADNPELQRFILFHERKELVIRQMCSEIATMEARFPKKDLRKIRNRVVAAVTELFVKSAKLHKEQSQMSEISKRGNNPLSTAHQEMAKTFTGAEVKKIETLSGYGLTIEKIASLFDLSKKTFERALKRSPGGVDSLLKGRSIAESQVSQTAYQMAISGKHPVMTIFYLKCRARWKPPSFDEEEEGDGFEFNHGKEH
jgi:hypothetical protein